MDTREQRVADYRAQIQYDLRMILGVHGVDRCAADPEQLLTELVDAAMHHVEFLVIENTT
jgi:hypothetical protein